jgi:hypothetical protein
MQEAAGENLGQWRRAVLRFTAIYLSENLNLWYIE